MKKFLTGVFAVSAIATGFTATAENKQTILTVVQAPVMVNQGTQYIEASDSMALYPGDRLMVMQGGSAQVQFANGCVQTLGGNEITTVGTEEACTSLAGAATYNQAGAPPTTGGSGASSTIVAESLVAAVTVGGMIYVSNDDDDDSGPASP